MAETWIEFLPGFTSQYQCMKRDRVLAAEMAAVVITTTAVLGRALGIGVDWSAQRRVVLRDEVLHARRTLHP